MPKLYEQKAKPVKWGSISKVTGRPIKIQGGTQRERTLSQGFTRFGMYRRKK